MSGFRPGRPSSEGSHSVSEAETEGSRPFIRSLTLMEGLSDLAIAVELSKEEWRLFSQLRVSVWNGVMVFRNGVLMAGHLFVLDPGSGSRETCCGRSWEGKNMEASPSVFLTLMIYPPGMCMDMWQVEFDEVVDLVGGGTCDRTATLVLGHGRAKSRAKVYERFCAICVHLRRLHNYSTLSAITSGLDNFAVRRMVATRHLVRPMYETDLKEFLELLNPQSSYAAYRAALKHDASLGVKAIPFL